MTRATDPSGLTRPRSARLTRRHGRFAALRHRDFRLYMLGQGVTTTGLWVQRIAQDWLVLHLTGSATAVGVTMGLQWAPMLVVGPVGGRLADRHPKRRILQATQLAAATLAGLLAVLTLSHQVASWHVQLLAAAVGVVTGIDQPVRQSFATELIGRTEIHSAISLSNSLFYLGGFVGPALSGVLVGLFGPGWAFALNAASFAVPLTAFARIRRGPARRGGTLPGSDPLPDHSARLPGHSAHPARPAHPEHPAPLPAPAPVSGAESRAALRTALRRPEIWWPIVLAGAFSVFCLNSAVTLAAYARAFHGGPGGYALLTAALALGSVLGALVSAGRTRITLRGLTLTGCAVAGLYPVAGAVPPVWGLAVVVAAVGMATQQLYTGANATVQLAAGPALRGRVMGVYLPATYGCGAVGGPLLGAVDQHFGPRAGLGIAGALPAAVLLVPALLLRPWRQAVQAVGAAPASRVVITSRPCGGPDTGGAQARQLRWSPPGE